MKKKTHTHTNLEGGLRRQRRPQRLVLAVEDHPNHAVPLGEVHRRRRVAQFYSDHARVHFGGRTEIIPINLRLRMRACVRMCVFA